jgi:hypothetical protein
VRILTAVLALGLSSLPALAQEQSRRFYEGSWQEIGGIHGGVESELLNPTPMAVTRDRIIIYDFGDHRVKGFSYDGNLMWAVGRSGQGPREFANPTDLQLAPDSTVWITDPSNQRLSIVTAEGDFRKLVRIPPSVRRCAPISTTQCWAMSFANDVFLLRLDTAGAVAERVPPPSWLANVPPYVREGFIQAAPARQVAVAAFLYSDRWVRIDPGSDTLRLYRGLSPVEFPKLMQYQHPAGVVTRVDTTARAVVKTIALKVNHVSLC